jgi:hypothetical protein
MSLEWLKQNTPELVVSKEEAGDTAIWGAPRPDEDSEIGALWNRMHPPGVQGVAFTHFGGLEDAEGASAAQYAQDQALTAYDEMNDLHGALEAYCDVLQSAIDDGTGMHPQSQALIKVAAQHLKVVSPRLQAGLEDYSPRSQRQYLYASLEDFKTTAKKVWEQMKRAFELLWNAVMDTTTKLLGKAARYRDEAKALLTQVKGQRFNVPPLHVSSTPWLFAHGRFVGADASATDTVLNYMQHDYYVDLEHSYKQLQKVVQDYRPGNGTLNMALFTDSPMQKFPGKPNPGLKATLGDDVIVRGVVGMPGGKAFVATAPAGVKDTAVSYTKLFNDFRVEIQDEPKDQHLPVSTEVPGGSSSQVTQQLEALVNRLERLAENSGNARKIKSIVDIVGHTAAELAVKIESNTTNPEEARDGMALLKGLNTVLKNVGPNTNGIFAYLVRVYGTQLSLLKAQVAAQAN